MTQKNEYRKYQIGRATKEHDWTYNMKIKFNGSKNGSNYLDISKEEFEKIKYYLTL